MTAATFDARPGRALRPLPLSVVALLAVAMLLNYVDRGALSIVAPELGRRFGVDAARMGLLLSAFFWTYSACQPLAGWLVQRFDVKRVLATGVAVWAAATMVSGLASSFAMLLVLRLMLGVGESVTFPGNACLFARSLPPHLRGRANATMSVAISMGPPLGALVAGSILAAMGWRAVFFILGAATFLWLAPWLSLDHGAAPRLAEAYDAPSYGQILRRRAFWGAALGQFCYCYPAYLLLTWLPLFLVRAEHLSVAATTGVVAFSYAGSAIVSAVVGVASDRRLSKGAALTGVYKTFLIVGLGLGGLAMLAAGLTGGRVAIACLVLYSLANGLAHPFLFAVGQTLSGPGCGGRWMGVQNLVGNLAGIAAPIATGLIVQTTGAFSSAFTAAAAMCFAGAVVYAFVIGEVTPIAWTPRRAAQAPSGPVEPTSRTSRRGA